MVQGADLNKSSRIDQLIDEIKIIRAVNSSLHSEITSLETKVFQREREAKSLADKLEKTQKKAEFLEAEKRSNLRKYNTKIKNLERGKKRNDIFNQKIMGTSKTMKESMMIQEMDSLRSVNSTLLGIIDLLGKEIGFDGEIVKGIAEIADGIEDNILRLFINGLKDTLKSEDKILLAENNDVVFNSIEAENKPM